MEILSYVIPIIVVLVILKVLSLPLKIIKTFLINSIVGGVILFALSYLGILSIAITWWVLALTGLFGIPGLIIAIILSVI